MEILYLQGFCFSSLFLSGTLQVGKLIKIRSGIAWESSKEKWIKRVWNVLIRSPNHCTMSIKHPAHNSHLVTLVRATERPITLACQTKYTLEGHLERKLKGWTEYFMTQQSHILSLKNRHYQSISKYLQGPCAVALVCIHRNQSVRMKLIRKVFLGSTYSHWRFCIQQGATTCVMSNESARQSDKISDITFMKNKWPCLLATY